jgi:hypothetical protein
LTLQQQLSFWKMFGLAKGRGCCSCPCATTGSS